MAKTNPHTGSRFDDFLKDEGIFDEVQARALKRALTEQLEESMEDARLTKLDVARHRADVRCARAQTDAKIHVVGYRRRRYIVLCAAPRRCVDARGSSVRDLGSTRGSKCERQYWGKGDRFRTTKGDIAMASYVDDPRLYRSDLIGQSPAFRKAVGLIERMANCSASVLLYGETGTGKELAARAIHYLSPCRHLPFIPVNCGAFPDMLVESELFGHERGAFTDARDAQVGLVAQADGGTLFLDEVDSLSLKAQIALLRFLQDGSYRPLGAGKTVTSQSRIVAATNTDLGELVKRGAFRSDLFYRLHVVPVRMPPLRERDGDVILLAEEFLKRSAQQREGGPRYIDAASRRLLERYHWPGNVRELANVIQRESLLADGDCLHLAPEAIGVLEGDGADVGVGVMPSSFQKARAQALADFERHFVQRALAESEGNVSLAARRSGKERRSFGRLIKKHSIDKTEYARRS